MLCSFSFFATSSVWMKNSWINRFLIPNWVYPLIHIALNTTIWINKTVCFALNFTNVINDHFGQLLFSLLFLFFIQHLSPLSFFSVAHSNTKICFLLLFFVCVCLCLSFRFDSDHMKIIDLKKSMVDFLLKIQKRLCASLIYNLFFLFHFNWSPSHVTNFFWSRQSHNALRYWLCMWVSGVVWCRWSSTLCRAVPCCPHRPDLMPHSTWTYCRKLNNIIIFPYMLT